MLTIFSCLLAVYILEREINVYSIHTKAILFNSLSAGAINLRVRLSESPIGFANFMSCLRKLLDRGIIYAEYVYIL